MSKGRYLGQTYGGHLERDADSVIDGTRRDPEISRKIDDRLKQILGGVPKPRAPRAKVVELPVPVRVLGVEKAA